MEWLSEFFFTNETFLRRLGLNTILAYSLYVTFRAGMWSLHQGGAMAVSAYTTAILTLDYGWPLAATVPVATVLGALVATVVVLPTRRLHGAYLAIATIAFVELIRVVALNLTITGGAGGLSGIPSVLGLPQIVTALVIIAIVIHLMDTSRLGRAVALHDHSPLLAQAVGVEVTQLKVKLLVVSSLIAAFGASLATNVYRVVAPSTYDFHTLVVLLTFVIVGGTSTVIGPALGVLVLMVPPEALTPLAEYRLIFSGLVLLLTVIFVPEGLGSLVVGRSRPRLRLPEWFDRIRSYRGSNT